MLRKQQEQKRLVPKRPLLVPKLLVPKLLVRLQELGLLQVLELTLLPMQRQVPKPKPIQ